MRIVAAHIGLILLIALVFLAGDAEAQCAMCKASAETSVDGKSTNLVGLNRGILYLLSMPYLIGAILVYILWRARKSRQAEAGA
jgi:hypothetical protein